MEPPIEPNSSIPSITRRYYLMRWIDAVGPSFVLVNNVLFMQARGLSQFEMNCWAATYFAVAFASDVPMGAFADAMGRRVAYVLGCTLGVASFLIYFLAHRYWIFLLAAVIGGVGDMMRNGAVDAWAVDAIASTGFSGSLDRVFSRASQVMQFGGMLAVLLGGYSARIDIATPWLLGAIGQTGMAMAAVSLMRGENRVGHSFHPQAVALRVRERLVDAIQAALANRTVLTLALANGITMAAWAPFWFEWPQYFNAAFNRGAQMAAWVYCLTSIATMLGAEFIARRQPDPSGRPVFMSVVVGLQSVALLGAGLAMGHSAIVLALFLGSTVCAGISMPVYMAWYNEHIEESHRATLLSFQSTCARLGAAIGLPVGGKIADAYGFGITWQIAGALALLAAPCYAMLSAQAARVPSVVPAPEE